MSTKFNFKFYFSLQLMGAVNSESLLGEYVLRYIVHHNSQNHKINTFVLIDVRCVCLVMHVDHSFIRERKKQGAVDVTVATKFAALPWRFGRGSVLCALKKSLERLGVPSVELYQLHWSDTRLICFFLSFSESVQLQIILQTLLTTTCFDVSGRGYGETKVFISRTWVTWTFS
jgi:hypothetical protein